jgi:hypothetical protein
MPFYGDILRANYFDFKNSINRQNNGDLEPLKGFGINFFSVKSPSELFKPILEND